MTLRVHVSAVIVRFAAHTSSAARDVVIASGSVRLQGQMKVGLAQPLVADRVAHPHAGGCGDGPRAAGDGPCRRVSAA